MSWQDIAAVLGAIGGIVTPILLGFVASLRKSRDDKFKELKALLAHLDQCLDQSKRHNEAAFEALKNQVNGLHLEVAREYASSADLRDLRDELRAEIGLGRRISGVEDALRSGG